MIYSIGCAFQQFAKSNPPGRKTGFVGMLYVTRPLHSEPRAAKTSAQPDEDRETKKTWQREPETPNAAPPRRLIARAGNKDQVASPPRVTKPQDRFVCPPCPLNKVTCRHARANRAASPSQVIKTDHALTH